MKRNWDIIREILLKTEELLPEENLTLSNFDSDKSDEISYHVKLLEEAGLIKVSIAEFLGGNDIHFDLERLTWTGHEFLDAIRSETIWSKTKKTISEKGGSMTYELIKSVAIGLAKTAMGI
jgi:DNA-binding transcriptional ArsR family regulator